MDEWDSFRTRELGQRALCLPPALAPPAPSPEALFEGLVKAQESGATLFLNRQQPDGNYSKHAHAPPQREELPCAKDVSLLGYASRITRALEGRAFCLRLVEPEAHMAGLGQRMSTHFEHLLSALSPRPTLQLVVFLGNYAYTPVGAHTDLYSVFQTVIMGEKRAHFWTAEQWAAQPRDPLTPERYLSEATNLQLGPGQACYWPAGTWHAFGCVGLSAAISIGLASDLNAELSE